jgi:hypothetical protein
LFAPLHHSDVDVVQHWHHPQQRRLGHLIHTDGLAGYRGCDEVSQKWVQSQFR